MPVAHLLAEGLAALVALGASLVALAVLALNAVTGAHLGALQSRRGAQGQSEHTRGGVQGRSERAREGATRVWAQHWLAHAIMPEMLWCRQSASTVPGLVDRAKGELAETLLNLEAGPHLAELHVLAVGAGGLAGGDLGLGILHLGLGAGVLLCRRAGGQGRPGAVSSCGATRVKAGRPPQDITTRCGGRGRRARRWGQQGSARRWGQQGSRAARGAGGSRAASRSP
jgi:hypothetical protein